MGWLMKFFSKADEILGTGKVEVILDIPEPLWNRLCMEAHKKDVTVNWLMTSILMTTLDELDKKESLEKEEMGIGLVSEEEVNSNNGITIFKRRVNRVNIDEKV